MHPTAAVRPPRAGLVVGLVLIALAVLVTVGAVVAAVVRITGATRDATALDAPGRVTVSLDAGRHSLWPVNDKSLALYRVDITGPTGEVEYRRFGLFGSTTSLARDGREHRADGYFEAPVSGDYTVTLEARDDIEGGVSPQRILIGPPDHFVTDAVLWSALFVLLAGLLFVAGVVVVIVALVRRRRARRDGPPGPGPPTTYPPTTYPPTTYPPTTNPPTTNPPTTIPPAGGPGGAPG